jgi:DNA-directed RNA polymerase I, II, and III subunit RPABC2
MPGSDDEFNDDSSIDNSSLDEIEEEEPEEEEQEEEEPDESIVKKNIEEEEEEEDDEDDLKEDSEEELSQSDDSDIEENNENNNAHIIKGGTLENDEDDDDETYDDTYLQKFNSDISRQYITDHHPEAMIHNYDEISALSNVIRDKDNNIIDKLHQTLPYLTKYERARVLGQRAKQINSGAKAFVKVPENIIDGYLIAELELAQKRIPFIIRRPIPGGACEYWKLKDLEIIGF